MPARMAVAAAAVAAIAAVAAVLARTTVPAAVLARTIRAVTSATVMAWVQSMMLIWMVF